MSLPPAEVARRARAASRALAAAPGSARTEALACLASRLAQCEGEILGANRRDLERAEADGLAAPLRARLSLSEGKLAALRDGLAQLAALADPVGARVRHTELDEGLILEQQRWPLGVALIVFESRPDAVVQIGGLALRAGTAVLLKGGREAAASNEILVECTKNALRSAGLPEDSVQLVDGRAAVEALLQETASIDVVIPRGGAELVRTMQARSRIPVLGHAEGVCHLYLDAAADPAMAARLAVDGKCDYPAACNATEALLVHEQFLDEFSTVAAELLSNDVKLRCDARVLSALRDAGLADTAITLAAPDDPGTEYGDRVLGVYAVRDLAGAVAFIHQHGTAHTDAICTDDVAAAERFLREVDSASVFHNASTRFADGYRYGLGAELGIATGRLHARGPVGIEGLLTTRWILRGRGQGAGEYGAGGRRFTHRPLR